MAEFAEGPSIGDILELIHTVEMAAAVPLFAGQSQNNAESTYLEAKIEHAALAQEARCKFSKRRLEPQWLRMTTMMSKTGKTTTTATPKVPNNITVYYYYYHYSKLSLNLVQTRSKLSLNMV